MRLFPGDEEAPIDPSLTTQVSVVVLSLAAVVVLTVRQWRVVVAGLVIMYIGIFGMVLAVWPLEQAVVKLVAGWMSAAILGASQIRLPLPETAPNRPSGALFRLMTGVVIFLLAVSSGPAVETWFPGVGLFHGFAALVLIGTGLFLLGFLENPLRFAVAILVFFGGFEIIYSAIEDSILVTAVLALANIAVVMTGSYLHLSPEIGSTDEAT